MYYLCIIKIKTKKDMLKTFLKVVGWLAIYILSLWFLLPFLFSAKSDIAVILGVIVSLSLVYGIIRLIFSEKVKNFFKQLINKLN